MLLIVHAKHLIFLKYLFELQLILFFQDVKRKVTKLIALALETIHLIIFQEQLLRDRQVPMKYKFLPLLCIYQSCFLE